MTTLSHGVSQPESPGLFGGGPSSVQLRLVLRQADLPAQFAARHVPTGHGEIASARVETLAAKQRTLFDPGDAVLSVCAGGAGYADPIGRDPAAVQRDVAIGIVSPQSAAAIYGVALVTTDAGPAVDEVATSGRRNEIRAVRLAQSTPVDEAVIAAGKVAGAVHGPVGGKVWGKVGEALDIVLRRGQHWYACQRCEHPLTEIGHDPKQGALWREVPIESYSAWNSYGLTESVRIREFCCPSCAHLIGVQVALADDPILLDMFLAPLATALPAAAE